MVPVGLSEPRGSGMPANGHPTGARGRVRARLAADQGAEATQQRQRSRGTVNVIRDLSDYEEKDGPDRNAP